MNFIKSIWGLLKFILLFVWLVFLILLGAKLAQQNPQTLQVDLLFWTTPEASVGVTLCVTLLVGILLGVIAMLPSFLLLKARLHKAQGKVAKERKKQQTIQPVVQDQQALT